MSRRLARFRVIGRFDNAAAVQYATVTIDRTNNVVEVRPLRRRHTYLFTLDVLADMAVQRSIQTEVRAKKKAKKEARRGRR